MPEACYKAGFHQDKISSPREISSISLGRLKIFFLTAAKNIKGKKYLPQIAQISADKKSIVKEHKDNLECKLESDQLSCSVGGLLRS